MSRVALSLFVLLLRAGVNFVPESEYRQRVDAIVPLEHKNENRDLHGWRYESIPFHAGEGLHYYYYLPGQHTELPVLLMLHGMNLDGRTFLNFRALSDRFRLIIYEFPERSNRFGGSIADFAAIVNDFTSALGIQEVNLCGVSFGGQVVNVLMSIDVHPQILSSVLIATPITESKGEELKQRKKFSDWILSLQDYELYWVMEKIFGAYLGELSQPTRDTIKPYFRVKHPDFYRQLSRATRNFNSARAAARTKAIPTLYLHGSTDDLFPSMQDDSLRKLVPQAEIVSVKDASHIMALTHTQTILRHMRDFYERAL
ncbi:MAG: alpha/beta fold hydrolase [Chitinivibrionales bacterium]|nr:alpha/beta fold hydrolase [Chitinivibrionales bacterium]